MPSVLGPNGATATTTYDGYGRPLQSTIPDGAATNYAYTYNPNTQTVSLTDTQGTRWTKTTLDGFGRVTSVVKGHDSTPASEVDSRYAPCACSPLGKVSQVSQPYAPNATIYWTTYTYDASGRPVTVTAPDGTSVTRYSYAGNTTLVWDASNKWKNSTADVFGNLKTVVEPDTPHGYNNTTTYTYNGANQLIQVTMQTASGTQTRTFTWSGTDLASATNPENGTVTYTYDAAHHVLTRTDAKNQQTQYTYDIYGRLTYIYHFPQAPAYPGDPNHPADPSQQVSYYYDSNPFDGTFSSYAWGRLTSVAFGNACQAGAAAATAGYTYMYGYTVPGRVSAQRMRTTVNQSNPVNWSCSPITVDQNASYGWDSEGRMTSMAYPGGVASYQYQYDAMGHLNGMTDSLHSNATVATASYGPAGEVDSLVHGGVSENFSYNSMWQLTGDAAMIYTYTAGQNNGRITQSTDRASGEVVNYTYDSLNRLASAQATNGSWGNTYSYDGFGNLTAKTVTAGTAPNFAASYNSATNWQNGLDYDANGNVGNSSGNYDVENRLQYSSDGTYAFGYDPQGKRVLRQSGSVTYPAPLTYNSEFSFYGITGQLLATFVVWSTTDGTQSGYPYQVSPAVLKNVYFGGRLILEGTTAVTTDRLGSVRTGASYYPWGEDRGAAPNQQIKFGTYFRDLPGEDYADQRYYSATSGRFWTPDPIGSKAASASNPVSWNIYAYVGGDPVNHTDRRGLIEDGGDSLEWADGLGGSGLGCFVNAFDPVSSVADPLGCLPPVLMAGPPSTVAPSTCEDSETVYVSKYLSQRSSPLAADASLIVTYSDTMGIDDRFIVALAGAESSYGKSQQNSPSWGFYNAFSNAAHCQALSPTSDCYKIDPYNSYEDAISDAINLLTGSKYFGNGLVTVGAIYKTYNRVPAADFLASIYKQLVPGATVDSKVNFSRCP